VAAPTPAGPPTPVPAPTPVGTSTPPGTPTPPGTYSAAEVDTAVQALGDPARLAHAQEVVTHAAPVLQRVLAEALHEGGWFGAAHDAEIQRVASEPDPRERSRAVDVLVAEQTRLGMFVGVTVGFQLAHELQRLRRADEAENETPSETPTETQEP
jgi:hypothetical protein